MLQRLAPKFIITLGSMLAALLVGLSVGLSLETQWLGLSLTPHAEGLEVTAVAPNGPAAGRIQAGAVIAALQDNSGHSLRLQGSDLMEDPYDLALYREYRGFFARQSAIHAVLHQAEVALLLTDHSVVTLKPARLRPLGSLPWSYWFQLLCGSTAMLIGVGVFAFRRKETATRCFTLSGLGLLIIVAAAAVYSSRELAMDGRLFYALSLANQYGTVLFVGLGTAVLWHYPRRLAPLPMGWILVGLYALFALLHTLGVWDSLNTGIRFPIFLFCILNSLFAVLQWRETRGRPASRAALKWLLYAWFGGILMFLGLRMVPVALGFGSLIPQAVAWIALVFIYVGIALGITRYRLFNLDRWVLSAWFWIFGGLAVILLDLLLVYQLDLHSNLAVAVSLAVVGWVYFPLRQLLWGRFTLGLRRVDFEALVPEILEIILSPHTNLAGKWLELLQRVYQPLDVAPQLHGPDTATISQNGLALYLPAMDTSPSLKLTGAARGGRLFNPNDVRFANGMWGLFHRVQQFRQAFEQGAGEERKRIARDLHDDVAARLLTLIHRAEETGFERLARQALSSLRDTIYALDSHTSTPLGDLLADLRHEIQQRLDPLDMDIQWQQAGPIDDAELSPRERINLHRMLQELTSNAINHAQAQQLRIHITVNNSWLHLEFCDDGIGGSPSQWTAGKGLHNIIRRAEELQGNAQWDDNPNRAHGSCVRIEFPLLGQRC